MTSLIGRDSRLRRTVRSVPILGAGLRAALTAYHRRRAELIDAYVDLKDKRLPTARDEKAVALGGSLAARARKLLLVPYRNEQVDLPPPLLVGAHRFDVVDDLVAFTSLPRESVHALIARRIENFRTEWLQLPAELHSDRWFYLSSRTYLFGNAVHFHEGPAVIDDIGALVPPRGRVLDFGGGTGNLALALAARGFRVDYHELSALQKEFTRFRVHRHRMQERIQIRDGWSELPTGEYDAICAFDVFEHLPDLPKVIAQLVPSLAEGGVIVDTPSFGAGPWNPMHYEDPGLDSLLSDHGLVLDRTIPAFRVWARRPR